MASQYIYNGVELPEVYSVSAPVMNKDADGETPLFHGGFVGAQFLAARTISLQGVWLPTPEETFMDMEVDFEAYRAKTLTCGFQRLFLRNGWYYMAQCSKFTDTSRQVGEIEYEATFKLADPRSYRQFPAGGDGVTDQVVTVAVTSGTSFNITGNMPPPWALSTVWIAAASDWVTFTLDSGLSFAVKPAAAGTLIVSSLLQTLTRSGLDVTNELTGDIFDLVLGANTITITGATADIGGIGIVGALSSSIISYREVTL